MRAQVAVVIALLALPLAVNGNNVFKFGAVLSTNGGPWDIAEAKNGYQFYFEEVNDSNDGKGFRVKGLPGTEDLYFQYEFMWREDDGDKTKHGEEIKALINQDGVHFLGGSHARYADQEMRMANASGLVCYHCCVAPGVFYEKGYMTSFGIAPSNEDATKTLIQTLSFENVSSISIIYETENAFTQMTCEAATRFSSDLNQTVELDHLLSLPLLSEHMTDENITLFAEAARNASTDVIIACLSSENGKKLVNVLHNQRFPVKGLFLANGPTKQRWVNKLDPPDLSNDVFSSVPWHHRMRYKDTFFNSTRAYAKGYSKRFDGTDPDHDAGGASAVGLTLTMAIQNAFRKCDLSMTKNNVERLLFDPASIECKDDLGVVGYDRVIEALRRLNIETFYGPVSFNRYQHNDQLLPVTTQVIESVVDGKVERKIEPVLPFEHATKLLKYPATNRYVTDCPPGSAKSRAAFTRCIPCERGKASDKKNAKHCYKCPIGTYANDTGMTSCQICPPGTTTLQEGTDSPLDCVCKRGYYNPHGLTGDLCTPCLHGAECRGGTARPIPLPGFWMNLSNTVDVYPCDPPSVCVGNATTACKIGYAGRLCAECATGYFGIINECHRCFQPAVLITLFVGLLVGWYVLNVIVSRNVASLAMILDWAQLANIIGDVNLRWTKMLRVIFGIANILDFDVDILEPSCLLPWSFLQNFIVQLSLPFILCFMAASGFLFSALVFHAEKYKWVKAEGHLKQILSLFVVVPRDHEHLKKRRDATIAAFLASVDMTYLTTAKYCFEVFKCEDIDGTSVLKASPDVECHTGEHRRLIVLSLIGIIFYVVGYLVFIVWKLGDMYLRRAFSEESNLIRFGFLYKKYELDYFYTPAIALLRRLIFVLVLVCVNNPAFQVGSLTIVINASFMLHVYTAPYVDTYLDVLFNFLLLALMFEAFGGLMFYSENLPRDNRTTLEWLVMTALILLCVVFLIIFALEMVAKYQIRCVEAKHLEYRRGDRRFGIDGAVAALQNLRHLNLKSQLFRGHLSFSVMRRNTLEERGASSELLSTFRPSVIHKGLKLNQNLIKDWDKLTEMLKDFMSDQSETSYLSRTPTAKFWRKLVDRFPEIVDFLAVADDHTRQQFNEFATTLYRHFYLLKKVTPLPLMKVVNWRDHAALAQWLAIVPDEIRVYFVKIVTGMFRASGNVDAALLLEEKMKNGGSAPLFSHQHFTDRLSKRQQWIVQSLIDGTSPLQHSASRGFDEDASSSNRTEYQLSNGGSIRNSNRDSSQPHQFSSNNSTEVQATPIPRCPPLRNPNQEGNEIQSSSSTSTMKSPAIDESGPQSKHHPDRKK